MTRRILLALLALTTSVLVAAVIPLGFKAEGHELSSYVDDARAVARSAAAVAEEGLADHKPSPDMGKVLAAARRDGDTLVVLDINGRVVSSAGPPVKVPAGLVDEAVGGRELETDVARGYVSVVVPVGENSNVAGAVTLARPLAPLNDRVRELWFTLAIIAVAAIGASAVLAFALARWVSRPLAELDVSARRLGAGDLAVRAATGAGPPELRRLATTFNTMASRLETLVHGHRAVVADVSHQLRTPLAALRLRFDLLAQDADPATAAELAGALEEFARLSRLVDGLLAVAKAEHAMPRPVPVDVREVVRERVVSWQPVADDRGVSLAADVTGAVIAAIGEGQLEQILDNLIANALDATAAGDHVTVSAEVTLVEPGPPGSAEVARGRGVPGRGVVSARGAPAKAVSGRGAPAKGAPASGAPATDVSGRGAPAMGAPAGGAPVGDESAEGSPTWAGSGRGAAVGSESAEESHTRTGSARGLSARAGSARGGDGSRVRVVVADDGPGMSPTDRARAFGRFTTASPGGTGLGLAIVYRLVSANGGTATLNETPGGGLSVTFEFPAAPALAGR